MKTVPTCKGCGAIFLTVIPDVCSLCGRPQLQLIQCERRAVSLKTPKLFVLKGGNP